MSATKILWSQVLLVCAVLLAFLWARPNGPGGSLASSRSSPALVPILRLAFYEPPSFFWWWFAYDAYAHDIFVEGGFIAASGGVAAIAVAVTMSVWRAREVKPDVNSALVKEAPVQ